MLNLEKIERKKVKKCNHENNTYYASRAFRTWGFDKSVSFNICADCGQMSDLEENIIKNKKKVK